MFRVVRLCCIPAIVSTASCSPEGTGSVELVLDAETTITEGLAAGSGPEDVVDGWDVTFSRYVVSVGGLRVARVGETTLTDDTVRIVDLAALGGVGYALATFSDVASGRWDDVSYELVVPTTAAVLDPTVSVADRDAMIAGGCTYLVEGTLTNPSGTSTPPGGASRAATSIDFSFCAPATVRFEGCSSESGALGLVVPAGGRRTAALTLHGDHVFFDRFPGGAEVVSRRAQWLADADLDGDDVTTQAELEAIDTPTELGQLFPSATHDLAGAPGGAVLDAFDYVVAQLRTQGHFQGEGECAYVVP